MKQVVMAISIVMVVYSGPIVAYACTIANAHQVDSGPNKVIEGVCSNNNEEISCEYVTGVGVKCDGPEGSYSGQDLSSLIYSTCGCSYESVPELQVEQQLEKNK